MSETKAKPTVFKIVVSRPDEDGILPEELVATIRVELPLLGGKKGRRVFLGLILEGAGKLYAAMKQRRWFRG